MSSDLRCQEIIDLLADYLDGSLPPETARKLEAHLADCSPCIAFVNTYRGTIKAVRRLSEVDIPPELRERLISFLKEQESSCRPVKRDDAGEKRSARPPASP